MTRNTMVTLPDARFDAEKKLSWVQLYKDEYFRHFDRRGLVATSDLANSTPRHVRQ